jgi:glutaredoxin 3
MTETIVWSKDHCPYCVQAKQMLASKGIKFEERKIDGITWKREQLLESVPHAKTVPQIFLYGKYVGGFSELEEYFQQHDMWRND